MTQLSSAAAVVCVAPADAQNAAAFFLEETSSARAKAVSMAAFLQLCWCKLPQMQFEHQIVTTAGSSLDTARLALAFAGALLCGLILRFLPAGKGAHSG